MVTVSEWIAAEVHRIGAPVFMIVGGGAMYLNDAFGRYPYTCLHHEQSLAYALEGYYKATGKMGVAVVTSGPGSINTMTGVWGQWTDSVPALYISGNVRTPYLSADTNLRQLGDQECDIAALVDPITKFSRTLMAPHEVRNSFEKAVLAANVPRRGPVWLDVPLDVQAADMPLTVGRKDTRQWVPLIPDNDLEIVAHEIEMASRPILLVGSGIEHDTMAYLKTLNIGICPSWKALDRISTSDPLFLGRTGTIGDARGAFAINSADLIVSLGCRMNVRQTGFEPGEWITRTIMVDIDAAELTKSTIAPKMRLLGEVNDFAKRLAVLLAPSRADKVPFSVPDDLETGISVPSGAKVTPHSFFEALNGHLNDDVVVFGNGTASVVGMQLIEVEDGRKIVVNSGCASMGFDLPAAIGASKSGQRVICVTGDGSVMMNLQEIVNIPHGVHVFVLDNGGYSSIRQTQERYFEGHAVGRNAESGVVIPDLADIARSCGIPSHVVDDPCVLDASIEWALSRPRSFTVIRCEDVDFTKFM